MGMAAAKGRETPTLHSGVPLIVLNIKPGYGVAVTGFEGFSAYYALKAYHVPARRCRHAVTFT